MSYSKLDSKSIETIVYLVENNKQEELKAWLMTQKTNLNPHFLFDCYTKERFIECAARDAILAGHEEIVRLLFDAGFSPNTYAFQANNKHGLSKLIHFAVKSGSLSMVKLFHEYGAKIYLSKDGDRESWNENYELGTAVVEGHTHIVDYLLECGANANGLCGGGSVGVSNGGTPFLAKAAENGNIHMVESLITYHAEIPSTLLFAYEKYYVHGYRKCVSHINSEYSEEDRIRKIGRAFYILLENRSTLWDNDLLKPTLVELNDLLRDVDKFKNNEREKNIFLGLFTDKLYALSRIIVHDRGCLEEHLNRLLSSLEAFDNTKEELQRKADEYKNSYMRIVKICMDYAMGCDFTAKRENVFGRCSGGLTFLDDLDISGVNFIGVSLAGIPITREILEKEAISGIENAILTTNDLMSLDDEPRKRALMSRLEQAFTHQGKLVSKDGTVNLVSLNSAAAIGDIMTVKTRIENGVDPSLEEESSLIIAARNGHEEIVKLLYEAYFDKRNSQKIDKAKTVVFEAIEVARLKKHAAIVEFLQDKQDVNLQDKDGNTLLHKVVEMGNVERVRALILKGADVNLENKNEYTPLSIAAKCSGSYLGISDIHAEIVQILLENKAVTNESKRFQISPLGLAVNAGNHKTVAMLLPVTIKKELIIKSPFDVDETNAIKQPWYVGMMFTALYKKEATAILDLLKAHGADFNVKNQYGITLLHVAVEKLPSFSTITNTISELARGCYGEHSGYQLERAEEQLLKDSEKAFDEALKLLDFLFANGADPRIGDQNGQTPLALLIGKKDLTHLKKAAEIVIERFVRYGADVKAVDDYGMTLLHEAACSDDLVAIDYLINCGAEVNAKNNTGRTPLHCAAAEGNTLSTKLLLERGADYMMTEVDGLTASELSAKAMSTGAQKVIADFIDNQVRSTCKKPAAESSIIAELVSQRTNLHGSIKASTQECNNLNARILL